MSARGYTVSNPDRLSAAPPVGDEPPGVDVHRPHLTVIGLEEVPAL